MSRSPEHGSFEDYDVNGTNVRLAVRRAPGGMAGAWATWGERIPRDELRKRIVEKTGIEASALEGDTGFEEVWHQPDGMSDAESFTAQLNAFDTVVEATLHVNDIRPDEIRGFSFGSGIPFVDQIEGDSAAEFLVDRYGLTNVTYISETWAACNSGIYEQNKFLAKPELQGQPVLHLAGDPVTRLSPGFDKNIADPISMWIFSDAVAGSVQYPGVDLTLLHSVFEVVPDKEAVLPAQMTYDYLIDWDKIDWETASDHPENHWQVINDGRTNMMVGRRPPEGMRINMNPKQTALQFATMARTTFAELIRNHQAYVKEQQEVDPENADKTDEITLFWAHHPNRTINNGVIKRLEQRDGLRANVPWVMMKGNPSAASGPIALQEVSHLINPGDTVGNVAYGAGSSRSGAVMKAGSRWSHREVSRT